MNAPLTNLSQATVLKSVCVYCGSNAGSRPDYLAAARLTGETIARAGLVLVYGGARVGLMGAVADAALAAGGEVHGIIPQSLVDKELAHPGLSRSEIVGSMHERKTRMAELSDGFIAMPGGAGTLEELFEIWTWAQLGFHRKPCGILNVAGYYDDLVSFLDHTVTEGFMRQGHRDIIAVESDPAALLERLRAYEPQETVKWIKAAGQT